MAPVSLEGPREDVAGDGEGMLALPPGEDDGRTATDPAAAARQGPITTRDDRPVLLVLAAAAALIVSGLLVVGIVRTLAGDDEPDGGGPPTGALAAIVPDVAASPVLLSPQEQAAQLSELLASQRHDVATAAPAAMLCAAVGLDAPLEVSGRWERDGQEVASTDLSSVAAPGFGDCVDDGGEALEQGAYQFLVVDADGRESAAGTIVLGAPSVSQQLTNDGNQPVCVVRIAPSRAGYYEGYDLSADPLAPGGSITIAMASTEQAVRASGCGPEGDVIAQFEFDPDPAAPRSLVAP
jgi:hypothetical protein